MPKLVVSKDIGAGLKELFIQHNITVPANIDWILSTHYEVKRGTVPKWSGGTWKHLNDLKLHEMAQAIYEGYEVELSPLEKLESFEKEHTDSDIWKYSYVDGVEATIKFFKENFEIKGVNDDVQPK